MSTIDWVIVVFAALLAVLGYLQGFIVGALSLVGFALGAFLGTRLGPLLLSGGAHSPDAPLFGLLGALLAGGVLAAGFEGVALHARSALRLPGLRTLDGLAGAVLTACVGLGIAWIIGAIALQSSASLPLRRDIQRSVILRDLDDVLPPSGPILNALARIDPLPSVNGPAAVVPPPTRGIVAAGGVRRAGDSVVRVVGSACGLGIEGSGWVAAPGTVVTNAHVVAGETDTVVQPHGAAPSLPAQAIAFDAHDDIAVLRVPGLDARPLPIRHDPSAGTAVAILGYPQDGPFDAEPGRIGETQPVNTEDAYGNGPVIRSILSLRGSVRPGNSGGPLVAGDGSVAGTVFAAVSGGADAAAGTGGFAVPNQVVLRELGHARSGAPVSTGPCAAG